jgi:hypothetical protein|tara:strand:- start:10 stop:273 length:264 start_codon:yes stop_codon:yes gene_type:complete
LELIREFDAYAWEKFGCGLAFDGLQCGPEQLQGGNGCGDWISWEAEERDAVPEGAESEGTTWLQEELPEFDGTKFSHQRSNPVAVSC